jgi:hypothetical protein
MRNSCQGRSCPNAAKRGQRLCGKCKREGRVSAEPVAAAGDSDLYTNAAANRLIVRRPDSETVEFYDRVRLRATWHSGSARVLTGDGRIVAGVADEMDALCVAIGVGARKG